MAIEIKELHIRIQVHADTLSTAQNTPKNTAGDAQSSAISDDDKDAIIAECVEQVLEILKNKQER